jgi:phage terminase large subunit-like protein
MVLDVAHLDEECPRDIYSEVLTRGVSKDDFIIYSTFTPDSGLTDTAIYFLDGKDTHNKHVTRITWDDVPHLSKEMKERLLASYSPHERECRSRGVPFLGRGAVYPVPHSIVFVEPFKIPENWPRAYGFDVGLTMTAAIWGAYDEFNDTWYLYAEHYLGESVPSVHADAIRSRPDGKWIRGVVDPASHRRESDGRQLYEKYIELGLDLTSAKNRVTGQDSGITEVYQRLASGRLKVFNTLGHWRSEFEVYRRDMNGKIVKERDHLMDATRYLIMSGLGVATTPRELYDDYRSDSEHERRGRGKSRIGGY